VAECVALNLILSYSPSRLSDWKIVPVAGDPFRAPPAAVRTYCKGMLEAHAAINLGTNV